MAKYKVAIDCGHSTYATSGKESCKLTEDLYIGEKLVRRKGQRIKENEFNRLVGQSLAKALKRCGIDYVFISDMSGKKDIPLSTRCSNANKSKADIMVSHHYNAIGSCNKWQTKCKGLLVLKTKNCQSKTDTLCKLIHDELRNNYSYSYGVGRDVDWSGFTLAILRGTNMPSTLIEYGFMDNKEEALKMLNPKWYEKLAEDTCKGICKYFKVPYKKEDDTTNNIPKPKDETYYRVITGSYSNKDGAEKEKKEITNIGYKDAFLVLFELNGKKYYRVVASSNKNRELAEKECDKLTKKGYKPFIDKYIKKS